MVPDDGAAVEGVEVLLVEVLLPADVVLAVLVELVDDVAPPDVEPVVDVPVDPDGPEPDCPEVSAHAVPEPQTTAAPMPNAAASPPIRPMYPAAPMRIWLLSAQQRGKRQSRIDCDGRWRTVSPVTDSRVPRLPVDEAKAAADEAGVPDYMAELAIFQVLLNHPTLARAINDLLATMLWHGSLDTRLRELAIMRIGWLTGSDYEWTQHWRVALGLGVSEEDLLGVRDWQAHNGFGPRERAMLAATDDVVRTGAVSSDSWAACVRDVSSDPAVLIELVTAIGAWRMVSSILHSLAVPLEDGIDSWPPDGQAPG